MNRFIRRWASVDESKVQSVFFSRNVDAPCQSCDANLCSLYCFDQIWGVGLNPLPPGKHPILERAELPPNVQSAPVSWSETSRSDRGRTGRLPGGIFWIAFVFQLMLKLSTRLLWKPLNVILTFLFLVEQTRQKVLRLSRLSPFPSVGFMCSCASTS